MLLRHPVPGDLDRPRRAAGPRPVRLLGESEGHSPTARLLREREQVTSVYREVMRSVWLESDARKRVRALAYVADRSHDQYAGRLTMDEQLRLVRQGHGAYGPNDEYVIATVTALEAQGVRDAPLHRLAALLHGEGALHRHA